MTLTLAKVVKIFARHRELPAMKHRHQFKSEGNHIEPAPRAPHLH